MVLRHEVINSKSHHTYCNAMYILYNIISIALHTCVLDLDRLALHCCGISALHLWRAHTRTENTTRHSIRPFALFIAVHMYICTRVRDAGRGEAAERRRTNGTHGQTPRRDTDGQGSSCAQYTAAAQRRVRVRSSLHGSFERGSLARGRSTDAGHKATSCRLRAQSSERVPAR